MQRTLGLFCEFYFSLANYQDKQMYTGVCSNLFHGQQDSEVNGSILSLLYSCVNVKYCHLPEIIKS